MLLCVCVMLLVASDLSFGLHKASINDQWEQWKITHGKKYQSQEEEEQRRINWEKNMHMIHMHNQEAEQGKHSYKLQMNHLGDEESLDTEILEEMAETLNKYDRMSREHILKEITETMEETDRITRYLILKEMDNKMVQNEKISRYHVLDELAEKMSKYSKIFRNHILRIMDEKMAESNMVLTDHILDDMAVMMAEYNGMLRYHRTVKNNITCSLPKSIDYREKGLVTRVKDQGHCGSCWAFSAAGALEGQLANKTGRLLDLSPQNLLDCVPGNNTCLGGHMTDAFMYVQQQHGGISSEEDYPYTGQMQKCSYKPSARAAQCRGYELIPEGDECALAKALNEVGPLSVSISTGNIKFLFYKSGIYYNPKCDENELNHAMLLVGYGETAEGEKYWTLKNSHGESWGEKGYMRMARTHENHCGIASDASYPLM